MWQRCVTDKVVGNRCVCDKVACACDKAVCECEEAVAEEAEEEGGCRIKDKKNIQSLLSDTCETSPLVSRAEKLAELP